MTTWIGINSGHLDSSCGGSNLAGALDGVAYWLHDVTHIHWFILDLGNNYILTKARGRSLTAKDPTEVKLYISSNKVDWVLISQTITTWQDTVNWIEVSLTSVAGRYVKVEITATEDFFDYIGWGHPLSPFKIIDLGYDITPPIIGLQGTGWELLSIKGTTNFNKTELQILYNGTYYTWTQATTNDNEEGEPLILAWVYSWDFTNQIYTSATTIDPAKGYWFYWYHQGELYVEVTEGDGDGNVILLPLRKFSI